MSFLKIFLPLFFVICTLKAQETFRFEHIATEQGLSQNDVNSIYQDKLGFMWFGTHDGLNKYDGYKFTLYKPELTNKFSISSNLIWKIIGDSKGNLWIGTTGKGLNYFDRTTERFISFTHNPNDENSIVADHISSIVLDSKKNELWIGARGGVSFAQIAENISETKFKSIPISVNQSIKFKNSRDDVNDIVVKDLKFLVDDLFQDKFGQVWGSGYFGLVKLMKDKKGAYYFQLYNDFVGLPNTNVRGLGEDNLGRLLIGSGAGLYTLDTENGNNKAKFIIQRFATCIKPAKNGFWVGTFDGLLFFTCSSKTELPKLKEEYKYNADNPQNSLSKNGVKSIEIDQTGIVWIGVDGGGVNKLGPDNKRFQIINKTSDPNSLTAGIVRSIFEDSNGTLWVGCEGGGINMQTKEDREKGVNYFKAFGKVFSPFVFAETNIGGRKILLIGSQNFTGLYQIDITDPQKVNGNSVKLFSNMPSSIFSILVDKANNLWVGTYGGGVYRYLYSGASGEFQKDILFNDANGTGTISDNIIRDIFQDKKGNIWFSTGNGLSVLTPKEITKKNPKFIVYQNKVGDHSTLSHNYVLSTFESSTGAIWVGTLGGGLNKLIKTANGKVRFKTYNESNGLPNNVIKAILEDGNKNLWISTNKGLSRFNPSTEVFKNYDVNDGLQSNEFGESARLKLKNGELLFGGVNGINRFFPNEIKDNKLSPETIITDFSIFNEPIGIGKELNGRIILNKTISEVSEIQLNYDENSFSFEFSALHFSAPAKNKYAYKLEGFDKDWIYTTSDKRFATYTNLEAGSYVFKVKSSNNDGYWDETPVELAIIVSPPFWKTIVAKIVYVLMFFGCLVLFRRFTIIRSTKKHQLELEHYEKEKDEEVHRLKLEFFTNISHEFRTPLTLIKGPLEYLNKLDDPSISPEVREQHKLMYKNTNYLMRLVNQLLDFRKMDKGKMDLHLGNSDIVAFSNVVCEPFQFLSHKNNIDFKVTASDNTIPTWFDPDAIEKVLNNLLSNAFKFTPKNGVITIDISLGETLMLPEGYHFEGNKNDQLFIQVKDSGPGVPKHRVKFIFERYYVDRDVRKINSEGTGIGLNFTKNLVELHKGTINVLTEENKGTNFIISLPIRKEAYENVAGISFIDEADNELFMSQSNSESHMLGVIDDIVDQNSSRRRSSLPTLLVVDDNEDIRAFIKKGFKNYYDIYEAENGERGYEMAVKIMPNLIISDVLMPVMNGIEMCEKLKISQETSHIPIVMLTAKTSEDSELEGLKTGIDAFVRKPFDMEILRLKIDNILNGREEMRKRFNREITLQPSEVTVTSTDEIFLQNAIEIVEKHMMNDDFGVEILVKEMSLSRSTFYLKIKDITGLSSGDFIRNIRLKRAVQLLDKSNLSVKEIMYMTGFNTASYFSKCFKKQFGVIPSKYVRQIDKNKGDSLLDGFKNED